MEIKGIDVSEHNGVINWDKVKKDGIKFAFIRYGYCNSDGSLKIDAKYETNIKQAKEAKIETGIYLYSYVTSIQGSKKAAQAMLDHIEKEKVKATYPIVFDFEDKKYQNKEKRTDNTNLVKAFLEELEKRHYYAMFYTGVNFAENYLNIKQLSKYDLWIAEYNTTLKYQGDYGVWQHTDKGKINGISEYVDMNKAYKDYAKIIEKNHLNHLK